MRIIVHLFAGFRMYAPEQTGAFVLEMPFSSSVGTMIQKLGIPMDEERVVLVNGRHGKDNVVLHEGDAVAVFPPMTGG